MKRLLPLLLLLMGSISPNAEMGKSISAASGLPGAGIRLPAAAGAGAAIDVLMATAVMRLKAENAACNGTQGDCADTNNVETWHDVGTGGNNCTNAAGADRPLYIASAINGKPALDFDGTDDMLDCGDVLDSTFGGANSDFSIVMVLINESTTQANSTPLSKATTDASNNVFLSYYTDKGNGYRDHLLTYFANDINRYRAAASQSISKTYGHAFIQNYDGSVDTNDGLDRYELATDSYAEAETLEYNLGTIGDISATTTARLVVAARCDTSCISRDLYFNGKIAEIVVFDSPLSAADIATMEGYFDTEYGISAETRPPPGYDIWLRADQAYCNGSQGDCTNTDDVEGLYNLASEPSVDYIQVTAAKKPVYLASDSCLNSKPSITFDGTDDCMGNSGQDTPENATGTDSDWAVIAVGSDINTAVDNVLLGVYQGTSTAEFFLGMGGGGAFNASCTGQGAWTRFYMGSVSTSYVGECTPDITGAAGHWNIWNYDGSLDTNSGHDRITMWHNGSSVATEDGTTTGSLANIDNTVANPILGSYTSTCNAGSYMDMNLAEFLFYNTPLDAAARTHADTYINTRYGL